jgi:hypothetical protein
LHLPAQHSASALHVSPLWVQNEGAGEQSPSTQYLEQQSIGPLQALPDVLQAPFKGTQTSFVQVPPQHSSFEVHASLSGVH